MGYTNADIVPAANFGKTRETSTGNFSTEPAPSYGLRYTGHLPSATANAIRRLVSEGGFRLRHVIYSYSTPIAMLLSDGEHSAWIIPDVTYSVTTSGKHMGELYRLDLPTHRVPYDATAEDIARVVAGLMVYVRPWSSDTSKGRWVPGPNWVAGA